MRCSQRYFSSTKSRPRPNISTLRKRTPTRRLPQHRPPPSTSATLARALQVRFVVRNTVEERIIRLQDKKRLVFKGTVGGDIGSLSQLSEDDLRFLFQN